MTTGESEFKRLTQAKHLTYGSLYDITFEEIIIKPQGTQLQLFLLFTGTKYK